MDTELLKKLQDTELAIMKDLDEFFREHNIQYSLYAGTLIGAIRHKGFIPWDDDLDICMDRKEYERFLDIWEETGGIEGYYLQNSRNYEKTNLCFAKVRKDNTAFVSSIEKNICGHDGIWVDIFPLDRIPTKKKIQRKMQFFAMLWVLYTLDMPYDNRGKLMCILSKVMLSMPKGLKKKIRRFSEKYVGKYQHLNDGYEVKAAYTPIGMKSYFPQNTMDEFIRVPFEDTEFSVTKEYDAMLRVHYGDYMQLPPEEDRVCKHKPVEIRF